MIKADENAIIFKECYLAQQDDIDSNTWKCSNCREEFYWGESGEDIKNSKIKYCPFCGCKIKEFVFQELGWEE